MSFRSKLLTNMKNLLVTTKQRRGNMELGRKGL
jgi:hypothetical protein